VVAPIAALLVLVLTACAPAPPPAASPAAVSAAAASAGGVAAPSVATEAPASPSAEWDQLVAAAKQEGAVVVCGPQGELYREAFATFMREFPDIRLDYTPMNGRDFWPRLRQERQADQYLWDLRIGGIDVDAYHARDDGILDPLRPLLTLPEVADESKWLGGFDFVFTDRPKQTAMAFNSSLSAGVDVNRDFVPEQALASQRDLVDPQWRGKIVVQDPRGGAGANRLATFLHAYGEDYVRDLLTKQDLVISGDKRQMAEWVVRGRYPIAIGMGSDTMLNYQHEGVGLNVKPLPGTENVAFDTVAVINRPPHPNAQRLFVNWMLTQRVPTLLSQAVTQNSLRTDVPPVAPDEALDPSRLDSYLVTPREEFAPVRQHTLQITSELLK
jgi:ABC-type Fe3+ transport system substrate-binding protein